jgi:arsenate reductase
MTITIWHNPNCGTSRNTLKLIRAAGIEPRVIEYLKTPPSRAELKAFAKSAGGVRALLRQRGTPYDELDLGNPKWTDEELLDFMQQHPILMQRPVVRTDKGIRVCRPADTVKDLLP